MQVIEKVKVVPEGYNGAGMDNLKSLKLVFGIVLMQKLNL